MTSVSLVPGALNFRDVGGLPATDGGRTRTGVLFRSGHLGQLGQDGTETLRTLGIRRIIDLRDDDEVRISPSRVEGLDVQTQRVPLFLGSIASFFQRDASLSDFYRSLVDDSADQVLAVIRGVLADQPVLVHCAAGKDRTGVTVALALSAAGVERDAVVADYARTERFMPEERNRAIMARLRALHPESRHLEELTTRSPAPVMAGLLEDLTTRYGSPVEYLRAHGLTDDELVELRRVLVEG
jgi:protein-tyrosine phosphatase